MSVVPIRPGPDANALNKAIRGFTELRHFDLTHDLSSDRFTLRLTLAELSQENTLTLLCHGVLNLELNPTGRQFRQFIQLHIEDVRDHGLEGIHFTVDEQENETIFFHCASLELLS